MSKNKYKNKKIIIDGIKFDSKVESRRYLYLKELESRGEISDLKTHINITLVDKFLYKGKTIRAITYRPDFYYKDSLGYDVLEDVKGYIITSDFKIKIKLLKRRYPNYTFFIVKEVDKKWVKTLF